MSGWIKLHRDITKNWLWQHPGYLRGWIWLLCEANYDNRKWLVDGKIKMIARGDVVTSLKKMSLGTGMSVREVRTFLDLLVSDDKIYQHSDKRMTHLTICNYVQYQDERHDNDTTATRQRHDSDNNIRSEEVNNTSTTNKKSRPKNLEEAIAYFAEKGYDQIEAEKWHDHNLTVGWVYGAKKSPVKDWKASARTWMRNSDEYAKRNSSNDNRKQSAGEAILNWGSNR